MTLEIGAKAPAFSMKTDGNGKVSLSDLKGKNVVLYFYPKDDTRGCTAETCGFRDQLPKFKKLDAVVIGVSRDSVESHEPVLGQAKWVDLEVADLFVIEDVSSQCDCGTGKLVSVETRTPAPSMKERRGVQIVEHCRCG